MPQMNPAESIDINALKSQVDAEIAARLQVEAEQALHIHRRGFHVGNLRLLVDMEIASEVLDMPLLFRLPGAPRGVTGLANRHGRVVPVVDIARLYDIQHGDAEYPWLLVCGRGEEAAGIIISSLPERKKFVTDDQVGVAEVSNPIGAYARGAYREGQDIWVDLDTDAFFASVFQVDPASI
jgi:chemotaxis signal transduction protein